MIFNWLSLVAGIMYIVLGVAIIIYKFSFINLDQKFAIGLGILLIVYGIFRLVRTIYKFKNPQNED